MNLFKNLISVISNSFKEKKEQLFFKENETFFNDFKNNKYVNALSKEFNISFDELVSNHKRKFLIMIKSQTDKEYKQFAKAQAKSYTTDEIDMLKEQMVILAYYFDKNILNNNIFEFTNKKSNYSYIQNNSTLTFFDDKTVFEFIVYKCFLTSFSMSLIEQKEVQKTDLSEIELANINLFKFILAYPELTTELVKKHQKEFINRLNDYYNEYTASFITTELLKPLYLAGLDKNLFNEELLNDYMLKDKENIITYLNTFEEKNYLESILQKNDSSNKSKKKL